MNRVSVCIGLHQSLKCMKLIKFEMKQPIKALQKEWFGNL